MRRRGISRRDREMYAADMAARAAEVGPLLDAAEAAANAEPETEAFDAEVQQQDASLALVRYDVTPEDIARTTAEYGALSADTTAGYEQVRKAIAYCRTTRVEIEAKRKQLKAASLEYGKRVDRAAKDLVELIDPIESALQAKKDAVDAEKERLKREAAEAEKAALEAAIRAEREAEEARLKAERDAEEARLRAAREVEEKRLAEERARLEAQAAELAELKRQQEEAARAERERMATEQKKFDDERRAEEMRQHALRMDEERLRREAEAERQREAAEERQRLAEERAENERFRRELEELKAKAEREEAARQAAIKAEAEAKAQAERDRVAAEEAKAREAERQAELARRFEAMKPDRQRIKDLARAIGEIRRPDVTSAEATALVDETFATLETLTVSLDTWAHEEAATAAE